jgi:hypothetical protein
MFPLPFPEESMFELPVGSADPQRGPLLPEQGGPRERMSGCD